MHRLQEKRSLPQWHLQQGEKPGELGHHQALDAAIFTAQRQQAAHQGAHLHREDT